MTTLLLAPLAIVLALVLFTRLYVWRTERRHPPIGEMVEVNGARLHALRVGDPEPGVPPLVFIHGASGNLLDQFHAFASHRPPDRAAIFFDRPGQGYSERGGATNDTPDGQADVLCALLDLWGIERAVVVGHSYGGAVAASFALHHPERTAGLLLVSAATHPWPGGKTSWYYELMRRRPWLARVFAQTLLVPLGLNRMNCALNGVFSPQPVPSDYYERSATALAIRPAAFLANARDVTSLYDYVTAIAPRYKEIGAPTIIITGDEDAIVHGPWHSEPMHCALPHNRLVVVPGLGHKPDYYATGLVLEAIEAVTNGDLTGFAPTLPSPPRRAVPVPPERIEDGIETTPGTAELAGRT